MVLLFYLNGVGTGVVLVHELPTDLPDVVPALRGIRGSRVGDRVCMAREKAEKLRRRHPANR